MVTVNVNIKYGKESKSIDVDLNSPVEDFRMQLFSLFNIAPDRQKLLLKGKLLKDENWESFSKLMNNGANLLMMGSCINVDEMVPNESTRFVEDIPEQERNCTQENLSPGLMNLGNYCYLLSTLQLLNSIPEIHEGMHVYIKSSGSNTDNIIVELSKTLDSLKNSKTTVSPLNLIAALGKTMPMFVEMSGGVHTQQCAEECWNSLMKVSSKIPGISFESSVDKNSIRCIDNKMDEDKEKIAESVNNKPESSTEIHSSSNAENISSSISKANSDGTPIHKFDAYRFTNVGAGDLVTQLFHGEFIETLKCLETEEELPTLRNDPFSMLNCVIDGNIDNLDQGLKMQMEDIIEKNSETLSRSARYIKSRKISKLPYNLVIHFLRFYWKSSDKERGGKNAKILRPVQFPFLLDIYDFCSEPLKRELDANRELARKYNEDPNNVATGVFQDPLTNETGFYELSAVISHQGRRTDCGHYVSWVKKGNDWIKFDDSIVSRVSEDEIIKLTGKGGGDWHIAYICLYSTKKYPPVASEATHNAKSKMQVD